MEGGRVARYAGPALLGVAFAGIAVTQLLGPSATQAPLGSPDDKATFPWHLDAGAPAWLVTLLVAIAIVAATVAIGLGLAGRWRPSPRRLLAAGGLATVALCIMPPIGSADSLSYAAYGRMVSVGRDPWTTTPAQLAATGDPVGRAVEVPWQHTPSVYGPIATAEQAAASAIAGHDVALTVGLLDVTGGAVFLGAGVLLDRLARGDEQKRRRAAIVWTANPLLWLQLLAGGHVDVLAAGFVLAAAATAGRSRLAAGALAGAAASIKAPAGLVWLGLVWAWRRSKFAVASLAVGAAVVAVTGYALAGTGAFRQLSRASKQVSLGTPWRWVADGTDPLLGHGASRHVIGILAIALFVSLVVVLRRLHPDIRAGAPAAAGLGLLAAYVLAAPYALPWYDAMPWVLLPLVAASRLDGLLLAHTAVLSLAYIPGRKAAVLTGWLAHLSSGMRTVVSPALLLTMLVLLVAFATVWRASRHPTLTHSGDIC